MIDDTFFTFTFSLSLNVFSCLTQIGDEDTGKNRRIEQRVLWMTETQKKTRVVEILRSHSEDDRVSENTHAVPCYSLYSLRRDPPPPPPRLPSLPSSALNCAPSRIAASTERILCLLPVTWASAIMSISWHRTAVKSLTCADLHVLQPFSQLMPCSITAHSQELPYSLLLEVLSLLGMLWLTSASPFVS